MINFNEEMGIFYQGKQIPDSEQVLYAANNIYLTPGQTKVRSIHVDSKTQLPLCRVVKETLEQISQSQEQKAYEFPVDIKITSRQYGDARVDSAVWQGNSEDYLEFRTTIDGIVKKFIEFTDDLKTDIAFRLMTHKWRFAVDTDVCGKPLRAYRAIQQLW